MQVHAPDLEMFLCISQVVQYLQTNQFILLPALYLLTKQFVSLIINYSAACFIDSFTLPLSKPITLTFTSSPSLTTSVTLATLLSASSEM